MEEMISSLNRSAVMPESGILSELKNAICTPCYFVVIADLTLAKLPFIEFIIASYCI